MPRFRTAAVQAGFSDMPRPPEANPFGKDFDLSAAEDYARRRLDRYLELFDRAAAENDLVLAAEDLKDTGYFGAFAEDPSLFRRFAEPVPGPLFEELAAVARRRNAFLAACYYELEPETGRIFNTLSIVSPKGDLAGKYRKVHLPAGEDWMTSPGDSLEPVRTELGMLGGMICYDIMFPETARVLALKGADVLLHPTLGFGWREEAGDFTIRSRAADNGVFIVMARNSSGSSGGRSRIVSPEGFVLSDAGTRENTWVSAEIETPASWKHPTTHMGSIMSGTADLRERWAKERRSDLFYVLSQKDVPLLDRFPDRSVPPSGEERRRIQERVAAHYRAEAEGRTSSFHW